MRHHALSVLCVYSTLRHHPQPRLPLCQILFLLRVHTLHCWASPLRKIEYSINHSSTQSLTQLIWRDDTLLPPSRPLNNIRVMVIVWRLRGNIIRTAVCWIVWHNVHSPQHTYMSSSYRSNRLSHWDPYAVRRGGCLELYYCNMVQWFWWDSSLISTINWFPSVLWHCWFGHLACKNRPQNELLCVEWDVKPYTLTLFDVTGTTAFASELLS